MSEPRDPLDLDALRALCDRATPGPWASDDGNVFSRPISDERDAVIMRRLNGEDVPHPDDGRDCPPGFVCTTTQDYDGFEANEAFIAAARSAVPALLDLIAELRAPEVHWECQQKIDTLENALRAIETQRLNGEETLDRIHQTLCVLITESLEQIDKLPGIDIAIKNLRHARDLLS